MTARTDRIDELFRQEIGSILSREVEDRRIGFATIIAVETAPDLRHAKVRISVIGSAEERRTTIAAIGRAMPFVRHELGKRLRLKRIPEFHLELDETLERGTRILHLLDEIEAGRTPEGRGDDGETLPKPTPLAGELEVTEGLGGAAADALGAAQRAEKLRRTYRQRTNRAVPGKRRR